jgi:hypothetical protein
MGFIAMRHQLPLTKIIQSEKQWVELLKNP